MTEQEYIIDKSDSTINECACNTCQNMCKKAACLGTPSDMMAIVKAGYVDRLDTYTWAAAVKYNIPMVEDVVMPIFDQAKGSCTFFTVEGKCELHDLGLKPLEGKLADCKRNEVAAGKIPPAIMVAFSWKNPTNQILANEVRLSVENKNFEKFEQEFMKMLLGND
jgi:hypothetical protein